MHMDNSDQEIEAVGNVWPDTHIRLCFWHLTEAWKRWLRQHVRDKEMHVTISDALRCMACARRPSELEALWAALKSRLQEARMDMVRLADHDALISCALN